MSSTAPQLRHEAIERPGVRWRLALAIIALGAIVMPVGWLFPKIRNVGQHRMMWSLSVVGATLILLTLWLVFASRLPLVLRRAAAFAIAILVAGAMLTFRIEGVTGDLRPIIAPRFHFAARGSDSIGGEADIDLTRTTADDYPQFLGPHRDGIIPGVRLDADWSAHPPKLLWRRPIGEAWSSFAVVGNYAITQEQSGAYEEVVCYELTTGKPVWRYKYLAEYRTVIAGVGPRATPTVIGGRVYAMGATGILHCLDGRNGKKVWERNTLVDANIINREWGDSCSPLVLDEKVIISAGGPKGWSLIAYHKDTGEVIWHGGNTFGGYCSPRLATLCGVPQILVLNHLDAAAHDPQDGHVLWKHPFGAGNATVADPIPIADDKVLLSAGYGYGSLLLKLALSEQGVFKASEAWPLTRNLKMKFCNGVVRDGCVFGLDDGVLACLDLANGKRRWRAGRYGHGQLLLVDDILLIQAESGEVVLVRANTKQHEQMASFPALDGKTWNNPALAGSRLLVRNDKEAACWEIPLAKTAETTPPGDKPENDLTRKAARAR